MLRRHHRKYDVGARNVFQVAGRFERRIEVDAGQEHAIDVTLVDIGDDVSFACPEQRRRGRLGETLCASAVPQAPPPTMLIVSNFKAATSP